jgi:hypothetical protein
LKFVEICAFQGIKKRDSRRSRVGKQEEENKLKQLELRYNERRWQMFNELAVRTQAASRRAGSSAFILISLG